MKEQVRQRARELGFDDCRFTSAQAPETVDQFRHWIAQKKYGEMAWIERNAEKRAAPDKVLTGARSIVSLAISYEHPTFSSSRREGIQIERRGPVTPASTGIIARYAQFTDYHDILAPPLKSLTAFLSELGGNDTRSLWYVDTGPVLERSLAERAGLGFVGKHTNLISRKFGNWVFLAEILTTLEFEPDPPEHNRCGKCSRCITACPTNAITAPFELDARRCISYLTIELKGAIPVDLRRAISNRIYGCDDCLAACPWNRFAHEGQLMKRHFRPDLQQADLIGLLSLDDSTFKKQFSGSPILRTKRRGLLRNVCVALGNTGDKTALPALEKALGDAEPLIAEHASWAMAEIKDRRK